MNIEKTKAYYKALTSDDICSCAYCRNYVGQIKSAYPLVADWLQNIGADIEKPFELCPVGPDDAGNIIYWGAQYVVLGSRADFRRTKIDDVDIEIAESHPCTEIDEEHFVIEACPIYLKWLE